MENKIVGYKVFNPDWTCRDFQFEVGKTYEMEDKPIACRQGFHFCTKAVDCFNYYSFDSSNKVALVEAVGDYVTHEDDSKVATNKIVIVKELNWHEVLELVNTGKNNTGKENSGDSNSGNRNSGNMNSGNMNSGDWNSGNSNSGDSNSGNRNSGNSNSGDRNSGYSNSGNRNSGDSNSGDSNSGYSNSGNRNSGDSNSGDSNSGDSNSGDRNSGYSNSGNRNSGFANKSNFQTGAFNTTEGKIRLFNTEFDMSPSDFYYSKWYYALTDGGFELNEFINSSDMTDDEKSKFKDYETLGGYFKTISYKEAWANNWKNKFESNKELVKQMPNFDAEIFYEITGIDLR